MAWYGHSEEMKGYPYHFSFAVQQHELRTGLEQTL